MICLLKYHKKISTRKQKSKDVLHTAIFKRIRPLAKWVLLKWGLSDRIKPSLKLELVSWSLAYFCKTFRSFNAENLGSLDHRAAKLPAINLWEWFNPGLSWTWADWFERGRGRMADFFLRPPTLAAGNFEAPWPNDLKFSALKDLNLLKKYNKYQETSDNFRLGFALSSGPHLHRAY